MNTVEMLTALATGMLILAAVGVVYNEETKSIARETEGTLEYYWARMDQIQEAQSRESRRKLDIEYSKLMNKLQEEAKTNGYFDFSRIEDRFASKEEVLSAYNKTRPYFDNLNKSTTPRWHNTNGQDSSEWSHFSTAYPEQYGTNGWYMLDDSDDMQRIITGITNAIYKSKGRCQVFVIDYHTEGK